MTAFNTLICGQLDAARQCAELLLQAAGPDDVKARKAMGEIRGRSRPLDGFTT